MKAKEFLIRAGKHLSAVLFLSVAGCGLAQAALHVSVKIPVTVRVSGNAPEESYKAVIERDPSNPNAPVASPSELTLTGSGEKEYNLSFEEMTYTASGSYRYLIKQVPGEKSNFTYDDSVYAVLVTVGEYDVDSAHNPVPPYLSAVYSAGKEGSLTKLGEIAFNNQYSKGTTPNGGGGGGTPPRPTPSSSGESDRGRSRRNTYNKIQREDVMVGRIVSLFSCKKLKNPFYCLGSEEDFSLAKARRNRFSAIEKKIISFISFFWKSTYRLWINQRFP